MSAPAVARSMVVTLLVGALCGACMRPQPTPTLDAAPDRPPAPAAPVVRDAAPDVTDAAPDLAGLHARSPAHHAPAAAPGGSSGFKIEGNISKADAEKTLGAGKAKLRGCYEKEHAKDAALHGKVSFRLTVDERGRVSLGEVVTSTLGGGDPEMCMIEALRDLKFAPPAGGGQSKLSFQMTFGR
jgi:hypothetical protein